MPSPFPLPFFSRRSFWFLGCTFVLTGLLQGVLWWWVQGDLTAAPDDVSTRVGILGLLVSMMMVPGAAAVIVQKVVSGRPLRDLGVTVSINGWWLAAVLAPSAVLVGTVVGSALLPGVSLTSPLPVLVEQIQGQLPPEEAAAAVNKLEGMGGLLLGLMFAGLALTAGPTVNAIPGFGEELGWRGFLQKEWAGAGFWTSSLVIGAVWGVWHAPVIVLGHNYPSHPVLGPVLMVVFAMLWSPVLAYVTVRGGSVIPAAMAHGSLNALAGFTSLFTQGGSHLLTTLLGAIGFVAVGVLNLAIYAHQRYDSDGFARAWRSFQNRSIEESPAARVSSDEEPPSRTVLDAS